MGLQENRTTGMVTSKPSLWTQRTSTFSFLFIVRLLAREKVCDLFKSFYENPPTFGMSLSRVSPINVCTREFELTLTIPRSAGPRRLPQSGLA